MDSVVLGGLVKRLYPNFNMASFQNRLKIQKMVYLMRAFKLDLGYCFNLYMYGPYCATLTRDAYFIENWSKIPLFELGENSNENKFKLFLKKISPYKNKTDWLELASTLLLIKETNNRLNSAEVIAKCKAIKKENSSDVIKTVFIDMKREGFL